MNNDLEKTQEIPVIGPELDIKSGVVSSEVIYFDKDWNQTSKEDGCHVRITEFDKNGDILNEVWGDYENENTLSK